MKVGPDLKTFFAEEVRAVAALADTPYSERVVQAFAAVPRENHVNPGPWLLRSSLYGVASRLTPDANPAHLYHNVLIALNETKGINIGEPSLWARFLARAEIAEGSSVLQVGAGTGYFTAILGEIVGKGGRVLAMETEKSLADIAMRALRNCDNITVRYGNGATDVTPDDGPFDLIVAFAGVTHPTSKWTELLQQEGRMLLPVTGEQWWGAMLLIERENGHFKAESLGRCGFFPCVGARDPETEKRIAALWSDPSRLYDKTLLIRPEQHGAKYEVDGHLF